MGGTIPAIDFTQGLASLLSADHENFMWQKEVYFTNHRTLLGFLKPIRKIVQLVNSLVLLLAVAKLHYRYLYPSFTASLFQKPPLFIRTCSSDFGQCGHSLRVSSFAQPRWLFCGSSKSKRNANNQFILLQFNILPQSPKNCRFCTLSKRNILSQYLVMRQKSSPSSTNSVTLHRVLTAPPEKCLKPSTVQRHVPTGCRCMVFVCIVNHKDFKVWQF